MSDRPEVKAVTIEQAPRRSSASSRRVALRWATGTLAVLATMVAVLRAMGHVWWCQCGEPRWFAFDVWSKHSSQHFLDPYSFTHVQHGLLFYGGLRLLLGNRLTKSARFAVAMGIEVTWEVFENTDYIISRYREATFSLDYFGDSIVNSVGDLFACAIGCLVASQLSIGMTIGLLLLIDGLLLIWIRDSLLLNVYMLLFSSDTIKRWQLGVNGP